MVNNHVVQPTFERAHSQKNIINLGDSQNIHSLKTGRKMNFSLKTGRKMNFSLKAGRKMNFSLKAGRKCEMTLFLGMRPI